MAQSNRNRVERNARCASQANDFVEPFVLSITASLRRAGKGVRLVIGNGAAKAIDDGLASLIARAIATMNASPRGLMAEGATGSTGRHLESVDMDSQHLAAHADFAKYGEKTGANLRSNR